MAPEIISSYQYTQACYVYAYGMIVYEIMSNEIPFDGLNFYQIGAQILAGAHPKIPDTIPEVYREFIRFCWDSNPENRPSFDEIVQVPSFIKVIKPFSFSNCQQIKSITFSENSELCLIDKFAFLLSSLEEILIPSHVTEICESAFNSCLKKIDLDSNSELQLIGKSAFQNSKIKRILISPHVSIISEFSFYCTLCLKRIEFSNDSELQIIKEKAFFLSEIEKISIPDHVKQINEYAYAHCRSLKRIHFSENSEICSIGKGAFFSSALEKIEIPKLVKKIEKESFQFCDNLKC